MVPLASDVVSAIFGRGCANIKFLALTGAGFTNAPSGAGIPCRVCMIYQLAENNSIVRGESMDILNGNRRVPKIKLPFGWSNRLVRCGKSRCHHKSLKRGGRKYEEIVIRGIARIT
jgi:hypothetical protein